MRNSIKYKKCIDKFFTECKKRNYIIHDEESVLKAIDLYYDVNDKTVCKGGIKPKLLVMIEYDTKYPEQLNLDYVARLRRLSSNSTVSIEAFKARYGNIGGEIKFKEYQECRRKINSFEYKKEKFGMTEEEFKAYNASRASTKENFIKRHGVEEGTKKWDEYCNTQRYAGSSEQWFVDKYGEEVGKKRWSDICRSKAHTVETYMQKYNLTEEEAIARMDEYHACRKTGFYSQLSQECFDGICKQLDESVKVYYGSKNTEFGKYDKVNKQYYRYDFVIPDIKFCIEFQGDHFHGNPKLYKPSDKLLAHGMTNIVVSDVWKRDEIKKKILTDLGFDVIYVWESDYLSDKQKVIEKCVKRIQQQIENVNRLNSSMILK